MKEGSECKFGICFDKNWFEYMCFMLIDINVQWVWIFQWSRLMYQKTFDKCAALWENMQDCIVKTF